MAKRLRFLLSRGRQSFIRSPGRNIACVTLPPYCVLRMAKVALCHLGVYLPTSLASCRLLSQTKSKYGTLLGEYSKSSPSTSSLSVVVTNFHTDLPASPRCNPIAPSLQLFSMPLAYGPRGAQLPWLWVPHLHMHNLEVWKTNAHGAVFDQGVGTDGSSLPCSSPGIILNAFEKGPQKVL